LKLTRNELESPQYKPTAQPLELRH
jgi:hypothetical protein